MSGYYEEQAKKTDEELCKDCTTIEPEWTRAHALTEKVMAQFQAEHFKPLLKTIADHVTEHLWDIFRDSIIEDTEQNIAGHIRYRVEESVKALLSGNEWAIKKYALAGYDPDGIRKAIAAHIPKEIQDLRMKELEAENKRLREAIDLERRIRSGY